MSSEIEATKIFAFIPEDNSVGSKNVSFISLANAELGRLLCLSSPAFFSSLLQNEEIIYFIDSFLRHRKRPWDYELLENSEDVHENHQLVQLTRRVLAILLRLVDNDCYISDALYNAKDKKYTAIKKSNIFSSSSLLDICAVYGNANRKHVENLFASLNVIYPDVFLGFSSSMEATSSLLQEIHGKSQSKNVDEGLVSYVTDICNTICSLVRCGGENIISYLQNKDGEVKSGGLCAAIALTYEATLPLFDLYFQNNQAKKANLISRRALLQLINELLEILYFYPISGPNADIREIATEGLLRFSLDMAAITAGVSIEKNTGSLLGNSTTFFMAKRKMNNFAKDGKIEEDRCEYICQVWNSLPRLSPKAKKFVQGPNIEKKAKVPVQQSRGIPDSEAIAEMILKVQEIFGGPDHEFGVGDGFVEACLSVMNWSSEAVVEAIAGGEASLPEVLRKVPRNLKRAWKGKQGANEGGYIVSSEAAALTKAVYKRQEREAQLNELAVVRETREYDDDYDDQYDDIQPSVSTSISMSEQENIRRYNKVYREEEAEEQFWAESKNLNRKLGVSISSSPDDNNEDGDEILNADSKARNIQNVDVKEVAKEGEKKILSAYEKRRKDKSKAIVGNHNRRQGALRKMARAGF